MTAFTLCFDNINEELLYRAADGSTWLSCVCIFETDAKGRSLVVQSVPPERYRAGERGPRLGHWREIGKPKAPASGGKGFNLSKFKTATQPQQGAHPQESLFPSPE
jgi:hypothetical protein